MTKKIATLALLLLTIPLYGQDKKPATLRELLLAELRSTHNNADWFVPANTAVKGLTAEQASWTDGKGNHSVGQLAHHLVFWNRWSLERLKGSTEKYTGTNDETFYKFDAKTWNDTVNQLDKGMNEIEEWVETADEAKLKESAQTVTLICTHNAYHIGQIIYVRPSYLATRVSRDDYLTPMLGSQEPCSRQPLSELCSDDEQTGNYAEERPRSNARHL